MRKVFPSRIHFGVVLVLFSAAVAGRWEPESVVPPTLSRNKISLASGRSPPERKLGSDQESKGPQRQLTYQEKQQIANDIAQEILKKKQGLKRRSLSQSYDSLEIGGEGSLTGNLRGSALAGVKNQVNKAKAAIGPLQDSNLPSGQPAGLGVKETMNSKGMKEMMGPVSKSVAITNEIPDYLGVSFNRTKDKLMSAAGTGLLGLGVVKKIRRAKAFKRNFEELKFREKTREVFLESVDDSREALQHLLPKLEANEELLKDMKKGLRQFFGRTINYGDL